MKKSKDKEKLFSKAIENECIIFGIETIGDKKYVHYMGYGYYVGDSKRSPYRWVEYSFFYYLLEEALIKGILECESQYSEESKQYIGSYNLKEIISIYARYDNGKEPKMIREEEVNADIKDGIYILIPNDLTI